MKTLIHAAAAVVVLFLDWLSGASREHEETARTPIVRFIVKHPWITLATLAVAAAVGGALVVVSGVVPIRASSGHWAITARLLDFAKQRSVSTYSLRIQAPPLDDEALVLRGASHYENACHPCHGGPGGGVPPVMAAMTPAPPALPAGLSRYTPEQLFTIVKHGIKFTGMPAWPVQQRDDEVWAVVAFMRRMPDLEKTEYRRLAFGESGVSGDVRPDLPTAGGHVPPTPVREMCWRCHGVDGTGRGPGAFPSLAGQRAEYLHASLRAFADGSRFSGIMRSVAANLSDEAMRAIGAYYEALPPRAAERVRDPSAIARGAEIVTRGMPNQDIPACVECHGPTEVPRNPTYPRIAAQHVRYLEAQLDLLRTRRRGGSPNVSLMHVFVNRLRPDQIRDVTRYYGSLGTLTVQAPERPRPQTGGLQTVARD